MAVNPVQFLVASNASILDGTKTITISGGVNASRVFSGTAVFLGGADNPAEAVSGTAPDGSGISTITLRNNWTQGDISNQSLVAFNTNEGLAEAISNVREIVSNVSAIEDLATQGLIKRISDNQYEVVNISAIGESLITANDASSQRSVLGLGSAATRDVGTSSGNLMEVGAFGWGGQNTAVTPNNDLNDIVNTGIYTIASATLNSPDGMFPVNSVCFHMATTATLHTQIAVGRRSNQMFTRFKDGESWSEWVEYFNENNSVNPLDYGLGVPKDSIAPNISNFDTNKTSGLFRTVGNETGTPQNSSIASVINLKRGGADAVNQVYIRCDESSNTGQIYLRGGVGPSFSDWFELYHSGNTNFNEFGGNGADDRIAKGSCRGTTTAFIELPLNSKIPAVGFSSQGTFRLVDHTGTNILATGITSGDFTLANTKASNKLFTLLVTVSGGLTGKDPIYLETETPDAKITVNF